MTTLVKRTTGDYETTYYYNGNEFTFIGEQASGECWIRGTHYCYRLDGDTLRIFGWGDEAVYTVANAGCEQAVETWIKSVLS